MARGGGMTAKAMLSAVRSSVTSIRARTTPPPGWLNGRTRARRTCGSSISSFSAMRVSSSRSVSVKRWGSVEKFAIDRKACESNDPK